ncbi:MAG TPA: dihydropteroate synthase [Candidatus Kapabacteria bacterium]|jgi:dihydropteroate synthase
MARRDLSALLLQPEPILMGVLNVTPDSFSDGGDYVSIDNAVEHALQMAADGAQMIDIGGESTRPSGSTYGKGGQQVPLEEELRRIVPVLGEIRSRVPDVLISIDTQKSYIANAAIQNGADLINDVSAGTSSAEMFSVAARHHVPIVLMHGHGPYFSKAKIEDYDYEDVIQDVMTYLAERIAVAREAGVKTILADVGIGFAKGYDDNLRLLKYHSDFTALNVPLVLGVSRKSSIGKAMGNSPPPKERLIGSIAAACYGFEHGARIIRTHDVKETREALNVIRAIAHS